MTGGTYKQVENDGPRVPGIPSEEELRDIFGDAVDAVLTPLWIKHCPCLPITWPFSLGIGQLDGVELLVTQFAQEAPQRRLHVVDGLALVDDRELVLVPPALDGLHPHLGEHLKRSWMLQHGEGIVDDPVHDDRQIQFGLQDRLAHYSVDIYRPLLAPFLRCRPRPAGWRLRWARVWLRMSKLRRIWRVG